LIKGVQDSAKAPQVLLSRTDPGFLAKLFEMEVPEIYDGVVKILKVVREPGQRAKISVVSNDSNVDPVGACVGMKGSRVQAVVQELRGEKIDIISHTDLIRDFIEKALSPAVISRIAVNDEDQSALVVCDESQLALGIGKKGQNVRLASVLTGYQINIMGEEEYQKALKEQQEDAEAEKEAATNALEEISRISGVGDKTAAAFVAAGFRSLRGLAAAALEDIVAVPGVGAKTAEKIIANAQELVEEMGEEADEPEQEESAGAGSDTDEDSASAEADDADGAPDSVEAETAEGSEKDVVSRSEENVS
jgi:N utilization substance protein A